MLYTLILLLMMMICSQAAVIKRSSSLHEGVATYYFLNKSGMPSCGVRATNNDMVVALSHKLMQGRYSPCGELINVFSAYGAITVQVIDTCAGCERDDIDLSPLAFQQLGLMKDGELEIEWSFW